MPALDEVKSSWADEVDDEGPELPPPSTVTDGDLKVVTEYSINKSGKKVKTIRTYKIEKRLVSKTIARRLTLPKFGNSLNDPPGPNPATTIVGEEIFMTFISSKEDQEKPDEDPLEKLKNMGDKGIVKCRNCNGEHWTSKCQYKDTSLASLMKPIDQKSIPSLEEKKNPNKYVPPQLRDGASNKRGDNMGYKNRGDDAPAIRITNLSESTQDADLEDLVKPFGSISKLYLAKDKATGLCKGFAYIHFKNRADAAKAITTLNGYGYDHLILNVDWSKPANTT
uniref:Eukaryotic translation initiation factor 3 subunit G n=1 Tax=Clastoptera arizonana TaxID=38151 RepID=A0A1B6DAN9_9HEMI